MRLRPRGRSELFFPRPAPSSSSSIRHRNALTERAWGDAIRHTPYAIRRSSRIGKCNMMGLKQWEISFKPRDKIEPSERFKRFSSH